MRNDICICRFYPVYLYSDQFQCWIFNFWRSYMYWDVIHMYIPRLNLSIFWSQFQCKYMYIKTLIFIFVRHSGDGWGRPVWRLRPDAHKAFSQACPDLPPPDPTPPRPQRGRLTHPPSPDHSERNHALFCREGADQRNLILCYFSPLSAI